MTTHQTGTREQWLKGRLELLEAEKELTRRSDELARRRQELPWVRTVKRYRFQTDEGSASLAVRSIARIHPPRLRAGRRRASKRKKSGRLDLNPRYANHRELLT